MREKNKSQFFTNTNKVRLVLLWLGVLEGVVATIVSIALPSESGSFLGLSPARLAVLVAILFPTFGCLILAVIHPESGYVSKKIKIFQGEPLLLTGALISLSVLSFMIPFLLQDLFAGTNIYAYQAYSQRLMPLTTYAAALLLQSAVWIVVTNLDELKKTLIADKRFLQLWGITFAALLILVLLIITTRFGLVPDNIGWGKPTVPLMEWQIWLGILLLVAFRLSEKTTLYKRALAWVHDHTRLSNWLVTLIIWIAAFAIWASIPVPPGFFATPPRAPNFEIYPFSDAAFYDFHAQSMLIGMGFRGESIPPRPLYILFLAFAHVLVGQDYTKVILLQTGILALLPVVVFWIGKKLANARIGLVSALFIIFREWTSIVSTPFTSDVSNSKLFFADMPAALIVSLVLLAAIHWLQNPEEKRPALLAGGMLGISLLVRTQIIIVLPVMLVFFWIVTIQKKIRYKSIAISSVLCIMGFVLAVAPWLSRSYRITGQFVFDHPESQTRVMVQRYYANIDQTEFDRKPGETTGEYNQRLSASIREKMLTEPLDLVNFMAAHWLNNEIDNLQVFPVRFSISDPLELIWPQHAFWENWNGEASTWQTGLMLLNLAVLTAGVVFLTMKTSWIGLLPLFFNFAYHFSNSAARNSGWRYTLPADWIFLLYFAAGIFALVNIGQKFTVGKIYVQTQNQKGTSYFGLTSLAAGILCIGLLPLAGESAFPRLFPQAKAETTGAEIIKAVSGLSDETQSGVSELLNDSNTVVMNGRMLYPRFYGEKEGEEKTGKTGYTPLPYARYVFLVAGDPEGTVIFPNDNGELPLRNASDVILAGCMDGLAVQAKVVILPETGEVFTANPPLPWTCSTQP